MELTALRIYSPGEYQIRGTDGAQIQAEQFSEAPYPPLENALACLPPDPAITPANVQELILSL